MADVPRDAPDSGVGVCSQRVEVFDRGWQLKNITIQCLSEAVSFITHMSGTVGNEAIVAREPVHTSRGLMLVPFLSGNAMRHRAVREPGAMWLIDRYGLRGSLSLQQLNFLLHGGNLMQSNAHENTRRIAEMHRCWPLLRLCGGSLPDQILSGSLHVWRGTLVCEENRDSLSKTIGHLPEQRLLSFEQFTSGYQYTRGDAKKRGIVAETEDDSTNLMIYSGQAVTRGAVFHHGFVLNHASDLELGCLLLSLRLWQSQGGTIGGNARLGHGRLQLTIISDLDQDTLVDQYVQHVDSVKADSIQWLQDAFTAKAELREKKSAAKKKQKELTADDAP